MCKHVGCVGCPMGVPGIQSSHGVAGSTCEANVWAWQHTHQSCRQQCTAVQQQLLASVMRRWMRMTTASHQSTSLRSSIAGSARDRSAMWSAAVAFVAPTHHVLELGGRNGTFIGTIIEDQFTAVFNWPLGAALSFIMMGLVLLILFGFSPLVRLLK